MFSRLHTSGVAWMRFYEFQWPSAGGGNCDLVLRTAAKEAAAGIPLVVHGFAGPNPISGAAAGTVFQLAAFLATATSKHSYFGVSTSYQDAGWGWERLYDVKYGAPVAGLVRNGSRYYRELRNTHVHVDCTKGGAGAQLLPKADPGTAQRHATLMHGRH